MKKSPLLYKKVFDELIPCRADCKPKYGVQIIVVQGFLLNIKVKSAIATNFRRWATERLKELFERIRDIRASEKVFYRQVLEIYATS